MNPGLEVRYCGNASIWSCNNNKTIHFPFFMVTHMRAQFRHLRLSGKPTCLLRLAHRVLRNTAIFKDKQKHTKFQAQYLMLLQQHCKISTYLGLWNCVIRQILPSVLNYHSSFIFGARSPRILLEMLEPEDEGTIILCNVGNYPPNVTASHLKWCGSPITLQLLFYKMEEKKHLFIFLQLYWSSSKLY